jgi:hypothetical protein
MMRACVDCGKQFDPADSMMGDQGQCQNCWEAHCDRTWWAMHNALALRRLDRIRAYLAVRAGRRMKLTVQSLVLAPASTPGAQGGQDA